MEKTKDAMLDFLTTKTQQWWEANRSPYLVSYISPELSAQGVNWHEIVGEDVKLAKYLQENAEGRFKVVVHPWHRAKVGLIPENETFEYLTDALPKEATTRAEHFRAPNRKFVILNFLQALAELDKEELDKVHIPVSVLARLLVIR
jgi:hypothetical protein